jgi:hypothetical protein
MITWMSIVLLKSIGNPYSIPYIQEISEKGIIGLKFFTSISKAIIFFNPPGFHFITEAFVLVSLLMLIGIHSFLKKSQRGLFTILSFSISYSLLHMLFSSNLTRYVYPILWVFILLSFGGIEYILDVIQEKKGSFTWRPSFHLLIPATIAIILLIIFTSFKLYNALNDFFSFFIYLTYVGVIGVFLYTSPVEVNKKNLFLLSSLLLVFCILIGLSIYNTQNKLAYTKYSKAQFKLVGEWYGQSAKNGDKLLMAVPEITAYYANLPIDSHFVRLSRLTCNLDTIPLQEPNDFLVGYWDMDSYNSTGIFDGSTKNNFGTYHGGLKKSKIVDGRQGKAVKFDGIDDYIDLGNDSDFALDSFTVIVWFKTKNNNSADTQWIISDGKPNSGDVNNENTWGIGIPKNSDDLKLSWDDRGTDHGLKINDVVNESTWYQLTITSDSTEVRIVLNDGEHIKRSTKTFTPRQSRKTLIGATDDGWDGKTKGFFHGSVDEVRYYNRVLSLDEISSIYNPINHCFMSEIRKRNVTYVVWESRFARDKAKKTYLLSNLQEGRDIKHFKLIKEIEVDPNKELGIDPEVMEIPPEKALIYKFIP